MTEEENKKQSKQFKEYYSDPEFKKKHLKYIKEKVECSCGKQISRSNMSTHVKTKLHQKRLNSNEAIMKGLRESYFEYLNKRI